MKRLSTLLLVLSALLLLGGCALGPAYRYNSNAGGGYYYGQSPYGNADTVIYGNYAQPWGWSGRGPGWGYGPGSWGYGSIGFGTTYTYRPRHHYRPRHRSHDRRHEHHERRQHHDRRDHHRGDRHRAPPVKAMRHSRPAPPRKVAPIKMKRPDSDR